MNLKGQPTDGLPPISDEVAWFRPARARGRTGGRKPTMTPPLTDKAQRMYDSRKFTIAEIAASCGVSPVTIYRHIRADDNASASRSAPRRQTRTAARRRATGRQPR